MFRPIEMACTILGTLFGAAILYFTMAPYFEWWPVRPSQPPAATVMTVTVIPSYLWWILVGCAGALLGTAWFGYLRSPSIRGLNYFDNRALLSKKFGTLPERFRQTRKVDALFLVGGDYFYNNPRMNDISRLILPDPTSKSFEFFANAVPQVLTGELIREITKTAQVHHIPVRWSKEFLFHTMILADTDKDTGWVHVESVLPYVMRDERSSYTIEKKYWEEATFKAQQFFDKLWENSISPPA
jgi:hypothetical protein